MKLSSCFTLLIIVVALGCQQKASRTEPSAKLDFRNFSDTPQSVKPKMVHNLQEAIGLWHGRFAADSAHEEAIERLRDLYIKMEQEDEYSDYLDDKMFARIEANDKKWYYKDPLYGDWRIRSANAVSLIFDEIRGDSVFGRSICAGNERNVSGLAIKSEDQEISLVLNEPGDDVYDGTFRLTLKLDSSRIEGTWTPFNPDLPAKTLNLQSSEFNYLPEAEEWGIDQSFFQKNISLELLEEADIEEFSKQRLRILRNLIFARHGYAFKQKDIRAFFEGFEFYVPISTDVRQALTETELRNIALMKRYEDYAEEYYDDYGR